MLAELAVDYRTAVDTKQPVRDCMLAFWHKTPEGAKWKKERDAIPRGKKRSEAQVPLANNMRLFENALSYQLQRALDCYFSVKLLRSQSRTVFFIETGHKAGNFACFVRAEKKLGEQTNELFNAGQVSLVSKVEKQFTDTTPTKAIVALCQKAKGKKGKGNKTKGGAVEQLSPALIGRTLRQIDDALSPLSAEGKIEGVSKATRETCHAVWARIGAGMSDDEKTAAIAAFNALAAKPERKTKQKKAA
jgi:hypothetical protein